MLERKFDKRFHYTAVEIDPVIVQLAETYVLQDLKSNVLVYQADAEIYVATCMETFDLICMDAMVTFFGSYMNFKDGLIKWK